METDAVIFIVTTRHDISRIGKYDIDNMKRNPNDSQAFDYTFRIPNSEALNFATKIYSDSRVVNCVCSNSEFNILLQKND